MSGGGTRSGRSGGGVSLDKFVKKFDDRNFVTDFQVTYKDGTSSEVYRMTLDEENNPQHQHDGYSKDAGFYYGDLTPMSHEQLNRMSLYSFKDNEAGRRMQNKVGMVTDNPSETSVNMGKLSDGLNKVKTLGVSRANFKKGILSAIGKKEDEIASIKMKNSGRFKYDDAARRRIEAKGDKIRKRFSEALKGFNDVRFRYNPGDKEYKKAEKELADARTAFGKWNNTPHPSPATYGYKRVKA